jgi:hypothetical protein
MDFEDRNTTLTTTINMLRAFATVVAASALAVAACGDDSAGDYTYMEEDLPSGGECETDGMPGADTGCVENSTGPPPDGSVGSPCGRSAECNAGLVCSAPFDGERGEFACVDLCIEQMDEAKWCADASSCCDPDATCTSRGYCVVQSDDGSTTGSTTATTSTDDGGGSTSDGGSTGGTDDGGSTGATGTTG